MLLISILLIIGCILGFAGGDRSYPFDVEHTVPLRGILAILVVLCHTTPYLGEGYLYEDFGVMGAPSVACFFFLSGYGLVCSQITKGHKYLQGFFCKRISKILIPMMLATAIYWVALIVLGSFDINSLIRLFLQGNGTLPLGWFLMALIMCYILFYVSFCLFERERNALMLLCSLSAGLVLFAHVLGWNLWRLSLSGFPIGALVAYDTSIGGVKL